MAAAAKSLACKLAPLAPSHLRNAGRSQEARLMGVVRQPVCANCRVRISSEPRRVLARGKSAAGAGDKASSGKDSCFGRGVPLAPGLKVSREQRVRRSVRVRAEEPNEAERQVQAKETLLRDALEEKSKKGEESKPAAGFKVENRQQVTAIVTGIISVTLAFGYLSLISLDSRGVNLIPPPPEALGE